MKQYLLAVHDDPDAALPPPEVIQETYADVEKVNQQLRASGAWVFAGGLTDASDATVVRAEKGQVMLTDGPYVESKEHIGGFWVIKARDLDEALDWAGKAAAACRGPVEVRPFQDDPEV
ncbi:MAG TPA: YciI family protein [Mycobacteriales bacterium]|nr:YciI family protein [Mycobacteriales bacterium]